MNGQRSSGADWDNHMADLQQVVASAPAEINRTYIHSSTPLLVASGLLSPDQADRYDGAQFDESTRHFLAYLRSHDNARQTARRSHRCSYAPWPMAFRVTKSTPNGVRDGSGPTPTGLPTEVKHNTGGFHGTQLDTSAECSRSGGSPRRRARGHVRV
jgi:hypothetical protein